MCVIGISFLIVSIVYSSLDIVEHTPPHNTFTPTQRHIYQNLKKERLRIFLEATIAGLVIGLSIWSAMSSEKASVRGSILLGVAFAVQYFWYILSPKSDWMVLRLTKKQLLAWQTIYHAYQRRYHIALVIGLVGYFLIGYYG